MQQTRVIVYRTVTKVTYFEQVRSCAVERVLDKGEIDENKSGFVD
jgi:hypothetical protein